MGTEPHWSDTKVGCLLTYTAPKSGLKPAVEAVVERPQRLLRTAVATMQGAEAVLQVRAAYFSDDGRGEEFHQHRPRGHAVGQNRLRRVA